MNALLNYITPYQNKHHVLIHDQSIGDIMTGILQTHNLHKGDYDKICRQFDSYNDLEICRKIYKYLKANTIYKVEPDSKQTLRSPAAILSLGKNPKIGLDCKSYSLFIGGILDALNRRGKKINWCYRFASYKPFDKLPHHVFIVVNPDTKNEIWCDPVISTFNFHKPYYYKIDKKIMALYSVSGIGRTSKSKRKNNVVNKLKSRMKKGLKLFVKLNPATASARNSFLLMVKLNLFGLARNLAKVQTYNLSDLKKFWGKIGGSYSSLDKAINTGKNKGHHKAAGVGFVPAIAAAIAAATPIILKVKSLLKSVGIDTKDLEDAAKKVVQKVAAKKIDDFAEKQIASEDSGEGGNSEFDSEDSGESANDESSSEDSGESAKYDQVSGVFNTSNFRRKSNRFYNNKSKRF